MILADERDVLMRYDLPEPLFGSAPSALLEGMRDRKDLEVHIIGCVRGQLRAPEQMAENLFYHAVRISRWAFLRTAYLPCIFKIRKVLRTIKPDIVHGQGTERYQGLAAAYSGFPSVLTIHGNMRQVARALGARPFSYHWLTGHLEPWAIRRAAGVLCQNQYTSAQVAQLARRTWFVPNAVQGAFFDVARELAPTPILLCVANITPYKNQNLLMRALDPIADSNGLRLVFLGRVSESDSYGQEFISMVKARPWCTHAGFHAGTALREYFRTAHLLVLPTREDNCPMVILEAMASGLTVAASLVGGIPDLIANGVNGLLFDPLDAEQVRSGILGLLNDPERAFAMAKRAKQHAIEFFHPLRIADQHLEVYREVCDS
jgi:glycosyltransferase involved in cell wall biosynthesis